jgi:hypothetical protein
VPSPEPTSIGEVTAEQDSIISQESSAEGDEASDVLADPRDCRTPPPEPSLGAQLAKRSNEQMKQQSPLQRKRHNPGDDMHESQLSELQFLGISGLSQ